LASDERDPREWHARDDDLGAERPLDLSPCAAFDDPEHVREQRSRGPSRLVGVDPRDLHVDARELGVVAGVNEGLARNTGPISNTRSNRRRSPFACRTAAIAQVGGVSSIDLDSSAPDSLAEPISVSCESRMNRSGAARTRDGVSTVLCTSKHQPPVRDGAGRGSASDALVQAESGAIGSSGSAGSPRAALSVAAPAREVHALVRRRRAGDRHAARRKRGDASCSGSAIVLAEHDCTARLRRGGRGNSRVLVADRLHQPRTFALRADL